MKSLQKLFHKNKKTVLHTGEAGFLGIEHTYALSLNDYNIIVTDLSSQNLKTAKDILKRRSPNKNIIFKSWNCKSKILSRR